MGISQAVVGAIIGALVGIGLQMGVELGLGWHHVAWLALVIGLLVGEGARLVAGKHMQQGSFVRAALVGLIALAGILGANQLASMAVRSQQLADYQNAPVPRTDTSSEAATVEADVSAGNESSDDAAADESTTDEASANEASADEATTDEASADTDNESADTETAEAEASADTAEAAVTDEESTPRSASELAALPAADAMQVRRVEAPPVSPYDMAWVGCGAALAYVLARGSDKPTPPQPAA